MTNSWRNTGLTVRTARVRRRAALGTCVSIGCFAIHVAVLAQPMAQVPPNAAGQHVIGTTIAQSSPPAWPEPAKAPKGAPNILLIMTDDVGFAATSTFGGPVPTPTLDNLAQTGLRYNRFNTTAICSPTRAALLTGRNPHNVSVGNVMDAPAGYDGYTSVIPKSAATVAEILKDNGYATAMFGKWHLTPMWEQSAAGPFDRWPTGLGFDYFYGFLGGDTDQFSPTLVENRSFKAAPENDPDYILDHDLADHAISWIRQSSELAPDKPFFVYYAPGAAHAPHQAPKAWLEKFRGQFDQGWDVQREQTFARQKSAGIIPADTVLTPRPANLPAWSSLLPDERQVSARLMEAYAATLAYNDDQIGRVIENLRASGELANTLVVFIQGDNGGSAEGGPFGRLFEPEFTNGVPHDAAYMKTRIDEIGGPKLYNNYPAGWAWAMNTPFQYYKQVASHFGGVRNGMVMSWPDRIKDVGGLRQQFHFVSDIAPTLLDVAGIAPPAVVNGVVQQPLDGISMTYSLSGPAAPSRRRLQLFEVAQNMGIYFDGWWAGTRPTKTPWDLFDGAPASSDARTWELYHVADDFAQARDLSGTEPQKLAEMQQLFWTQAARNNILPLHVPGEGTAGMPTMGSRSRFVYTGRHSRISENAAPHTVGHSFTITAAVTVTAGHSDGVLVAHGGKAGGYSFYVKDGRPSFHYNALERRQYAIRAPDALTPGTHSLAADFVKDAQGDGGKLTLAVDGKPVANGRIDQRLRPWISYVEGFDVGEDSVTAVTSDYTVADSAFSGDLGQVVFEIR